MNPGRLENRTGSHSNSKIKTRMMDELPCELTIRNSNRLGFGVTVFCAVDWKVVGLGLDENG